MSEKEKSKPLLKDEYGFIYKKYPGEDLVLEVMELMSKTLSEPYPIYTYRYFLDSWPDLCIMCYDSNKESNNFIGGIVGGIEVTSKKKTKGYIAMIAIKDEYRGKKIAQNIVNLFVERIKTYYNLDEIYLETEVDNIAALKLYESAGFIRVKLHTNYYLNGKSAYRLKYFIN